jgi:hypothetical protein
MLHDSGITILVNGTDVANESAELTVLVTDSADSFTLSAP